MLDMLRFGATSPAPGPAVRVPPLRTRALPSAVAASERRFEVGAMLCWWRTYSAATASICPGAGNQLPRALYVEPSVARMSRTRAATTCCRAPLAPPPPAFTNCVVGRRETHCEFCDRRLPDWKATLTPTCGADAPAVMNVNFDGRTYR